MSPHLEAHVEFLAAFEAGPMVHYLLSGRCRPEMRRLYRRWISTRIEAACVHIEGVPSDLRESRHLERLSTLSYYCTAADIDDGREAEHLQAAMLLLESILAERGDR